MQEFYYLAGYFDSDLSFPGISVSPTRVTDMYEMEFYYESGISYINGERIPISRGTVLTICPGTVRYSEMPLRNYYIKIGKGGEFFFDFFKSSPTVSTCTVLDTCRAVIIDILNAQSQQNIYRTYACFCSLFAALHEDRARVRSTYDHPYKAVIDQALRYMDKHLAEPCSLETIAEEVHLTPIYFHNRFLEATGDTPHSYLTKIRLEKAKALLLSGNQSCAEIAELCGFSSDIYFSTVFKKHIGQTPRQYRISKMKAYWK